MPQFVGVNRDIVNWEWHDDACTMNLLLHLLVLSADEPTEYHGVTLEVGQLVITVGELSRMLGQTVQKVRTGLERLKRCGIITSRTTNKYTLVTVEKSSLYVLVKEKTTNKITNEQQTNNKQKSGEEAEEVLPDQAPKRGKKASRPSEDYSPEFETFWEQYPRHTAKKTAYRAWRAVNPKGDNPTMEEQEAILRDIAARRGRGEWQEAAYIPYPATYLNGRRWEDEEPKAGRNGPVGKGYHNPFIQMALEAEERERNEGNGNKESAGNDTGTMAEFCQWPES